MPPAASAPGPPAGAGEAGGLEIGLAARGALRWAAIDAGFPLEEARRRLDLSPVAAVALGRALVAAALIQRISLKHAAKIVLEVLGDGPLGKVVAEADERGRLRGLVGQPQLPTPEAGAARIAASIGDGTLRVTRHGRRGRYTSQVALVSGELGDDVTHYLEQSEQIRSAVLLGVLPRPAGVSAAGGCVVEALPGTEGETIDRLEDNIRRLEGVGSQLERGGTAALAAAVLDGFEQEVVERQPVEYYCGCSRDSLLVQLRPLARRDLDELTDGTGRCEAICAFCGAVYLFEGEELLGLA